mmetsp:Transcript_5175/g.13282  ORF Transcript_5175/g.13282 Transcript_5175/m.13282 type:complete len:258 (-) Transcript_5175:796-1569(-)
MAPSTWRALSTRPWRRAVVQWGPWHPCQQAADGAAPIRRTRTRTTRMPLSRSSAVRIGATCTPETGRRTTAAAQRRPRQRLRRRHCSHRHRCARWARTRALCPSPPWTRCSWMTAMATAMAPTAVGAARTISDTSRRHRTRLLAQSGASTLRTAAPRPCAWPVAPVEGAVGVCCRGPRARAQRWPLPRSMSSTCSASHAGLSSWTRSVGAQARALATTLHCSREAARARPSLPPSRPTRAVAAVVGASGLVVHTAPT